MSRHVIIVGAGPGGLVAAALLSHAGLRVTVLERRPHAGGRTSNFTAEGFRFDYGPTFFHYPQVLQSIMQSLGHDLWKAVELIRLDPHYRLVFGGGGELVSTSNIRAMEAAVRKINPEDARHLSRFLLDNREKLRKFRPFLETSFDSWRDTIQPRLAKNTPFGLLSLLPLLKPWRSLDSELSRYFSDPRVRLAFSFQSKYLGMSPFECPSLFTILSFLEYEYGIYHPVGGCGSLTAALNRICVQQGASIHLNEPVEEILVNGRKAVGVRTARGEYKADAVVINADFARAISRLVPNRSRRRWQDHKIATKTFSCSAFMLYLGLRGVYNNVGHHTLYIAKDYARNMEDIAHRHVLSDDPSFYVQNACVTDPSLAPPGKSTLYVLVPVTHQTRAIDWNRERPRYRELILDKLAAIGATDIRSRIKYERILTPAAWETEFNLHQGSVFGLAHTWSQMLHLRPRNRFEDLDSVYLVGGSTHPGSGLPVIFESARISSRLLLQDLGERVPWDERSNESVVAGVA